MRPLDAVPLTVTIDRSRLLADLETLAGFGRGPDGGITRRALSEEDAAARRYVKQRMTEAGFAVSHDEVGNLHGRFGAGDQPVVMTGSHLDTVPSGGRLDGPLGVVGAIAAVEALGRAGFSPRRPIEVVVFVGEEGSRFRRGTIGSAALSGHVEVDAIHALVDGDGISYRDALSTYGDEGEARPTRMSKGEVHAFVELHVEQGGLLEAEALDIGAVTAIAGLVQRQLSFLGEANHAGATPMHLRHDALLAAATFALEIERIACELGGGAVGTIGKLEVMPGGKNIIPGRVEAICDLRAPSAALLSALDERVRAAFAAAGVARGVLTRESLLQRVEPGLMEERVITTVERAAAASGLKSRRMVSGAIHDALHMAELCPSSMIFVPSLGGRSHCPDEETSPEQLERGCEVLARSLADLAS
jgi:allantoate deiminase